MMRKLFQVLFVLLDWSKGVRHSRATILVAALAGGISGLCSTALIAVINASLAGRGTPRMALVAEFTALCLVVPVSGFVSQALLLRLTAQAAYDLRIQLSSRILSAPYRLLEELGAHRLLATINDDIPAVTNAISSLPVVLMQLAIMAGCLIYLGWLSWPMLLLMLAYMLVGILAYQLPLLKSVKHFRLMRKEWDAMFRAIGALTQGAKELKLNRGRRDAFRAQQLEPAVEGIRHYGILANTLTIAASNWGQVAFFIFIGLSLFLSPRFINMDHQALTGFTLAVLYMITPLAILLNAIPIFGRAYVAAETVQQLGLSLQDQRSESIAWGPPPTPPTPSTQSTPPNIPWRRLEMGGVTHVHRQDGGVDEFHLGPLDLAFHPGELVFLIGGNGSGKTTLAKLLMGLYEPERGEIRLDGRVVSTENRDEYRQHFSVVFYDFYLFERLFGVDSRHLEARGHEYLVRLQLDRKVRIESDRLSTMDLSQGQRKRLALLTAYLEDRPIYVFDEWASDQDPMFKQVFYYQILPELKARGKTVIVITHDDRYYDVADRLIKLERGQVEYDRWVGIAASDTKALAAGRTDR